MTSGGLPVLYEPHGFAAFGLGVDLWGLLNGVSGLIPPLILANFNGQKII